MASKAIDDDDDELEAMISGVKERAADEVKKSEEEAADEVVQELDVYFSQKLNRNLYVLQYPLRPRWKPYDMSRLTSVKLKPKQKRLRMEFTVDMENGPYDPENQLMVPGHSHIDGSIYRQFALESYAAPPITSLAVGVFRAGALYLTPIVAAEPPHSGQSASSSTTPPTASREPIKVDDGNELDDGEQAPAVKEESGQQQPALSAILQMRPDFSYLPSSDESDEAASDGKKASGKEDADKSGVDDGLHIRFKKKESERARAARERSYTWLAKEREQEDWLTLHFQPDAALQDELWNQLMVSLEVEDGPEFLMDRVDYVDRLTSAPSVYEDASPATTSMNNDGLGGTASSLLSADYAPTSDQPLQQSRLAGLSLQRRVQLVMAKARIFPWTNLQLMFRGTSDADLLACLSNVAVLVDGRWIVTGRVLFEHDPRAARLWNYLLSMFAAARYVSRQTYCQITGATHVQSKQFFESIAENIIGSGWRLKIPPNDDRFLLQHRALVDEHRQRLATIASQPVVDEQRFVDRIALAVPAAMTPPPAAAATTAAASSMASSAPVAGNEPFLSALRLQVRSLLADLGVVSLAVIRQRLAVAVRHPTQRSSPLYNQSLTDAQIRRALADEAFELSTDVYTRAHSPDPNIDMYRAVVLNLFRESSRLQKKTVVEAWKTHTGSVASQNVYHMIMKELAVGNKSGSWELKDPDNHD